uniref:Protein Vpu n=1 Tax=SIVcpz Ptt-04Cam155 TaxID=878457 RepID=E8ZER2_SIV|nr:Vpu protein [SIVcpz Ptt-04Cam155]
MHLVYLIISIILILLNIVVWSKVWIDYQHIKVKEKIQRLAIRIREREQDSGNESNGEDEEILEHLVQKHGFANPLFDL